MNRIFVVVDRSVMVKILVSSSHLLPTVEDAIVPSKHHMKEVT